MTDLMSRRRYLSLSLLGLFELSAVGCGTVLHPERRGQPAGPLDWEIVALDAVGLLFFFVPGVIAFAVDFSNGSIYLPAHEQRAPASSPPPSSPPPVSQRSTRQKLIAIEMPAKKLSPAAIERAIADHSGRDVRLVDGGYRTQKLERLDEFWVVRDEFEVDAAA